jgi:hypothetical protein
MRMQPCSTSSASPLHFLLLLLAPVAASPSPLHAVAVKRTITMQPQSTASPESPELSADQSSTLKRRDPGTPITTLDDGFVIEESSGLATNLPEPAPTRPAINATQNPQNPPPPPPPQDVQTQAVQSSSGHQTTAAPQPGNGNTNAVTTPVSSRDPAALPGTMSPDTVPTSR